MTGRRALTTDPLPPDAQLESEHTNPLVSFDGIWRYWGRGKSRWPVLCGLDLQLAPGTVTCVGGRNGAGKTTLLRIGTAILTPTAGSVTVDGIPSDRNWREYHRRIGFLSAGDRGLYARFSVRGHLAFGARLGFVPGARHREVVEKALVDFGLADLAKRRADRLSQGQRQRLRLALTFVHEPKVLLLDEPRNSLDEEGLDILVGAIDEVLARQGAVLWCAPQGERQPIKFHRSFLIEDGILKPG